MLRARRGGDFPAEHFFAENVRHRPPAFPYKGFLMRLFLLRHAIAKNGVPDEARPLSRAGCGQVERLCSLINSGMFSGVAQIWHSPFARAAETARLFKESAGIASPLVEFKNMRPSDDPREMARAVASICVFGGDLMIVGHNPHLEGLADILLGGAAVYFSNCALACFELEEMPNIENETGSWSLSFLLSPNELC